MPLEADLFFSFRSPYSYLATPQLRAIVARYDLALRVRPVLPLAVRKENFFRDVNPLWPAYLFRDVHRVAEYHGIEFGWPRPDPIVQDMQTFEVAKEQPYIYRLTRLGVAAEETGRGLDFIGEVSGVIWNGKVEGWNEGNHLDAAARRADVDLPSLDRKIASDPERYDAIVAENQAALETAGHWGVPTMVFEGEPFFGQDRIDLFLWRLKQRGLRER